MRHSDVEARLERLESLDMQPVGPQSGLVSGTSSSVRNIFAYRELLVLLVRRELRARYKNSSLGFMWSLVKPIAQLIIYFVVIGKFLGAARAIPEFAIFVFAGLTMWALFNETVSGGAGSVVANSGLVKKVYLPREVFPLSTVGSAMINFGIQFAVLVVGTIVVGDFPWSKRLLYVPVAIALVLVFATALAILLSAINVYLRDVQHLMEIVTMILFWASPIIYSFAFVTDFLQGSWLEELYLSNPVTLAVLAFQRGMWVAGADQPFPDHMPIRLGIALALSLALLWVSQRVFARLEGNFAQEL
ncbi:ABC transporter permease [Blastococcus saxobsidens]|uniref:Transport permease protein n=1 Tax=Blastococcus saxobsidens (strain DD2) TaxID=1146883 RepID=H6RL15_BLASD|nr:ABC transporter permease [Blastococcus saxobsidens]CCG04982.1 Lipopolysaccharide exporter (ABC2 transporter) [Blastococcus saxobsidens DD2]